jgi:plasmid replication initiation protein
LERLLDTKVRWEDAEYMGISSVLMSKQRRQSGWVHYSFGELLAKNLLLPRIFARLRPHFMMRLRSKYAITLYEILEAYINRCETSLTVSIDEFRLWMKVPKDAYPNWIDLRICLQKEALKIQRFLTTVLPSWLTGIAIHAEFAP